MVKTQKTFVENLLVKTNLGVVGQARAGSEAAGGESSNHSKQSNFETNKERGIYGSYAFRSFGAFIYGFWLICWTVAFSTIVGTFASEIHSASSWTFKAL